MCGISVVGHNLTNNLTFVSQGLPVQHKLKLSRGLAPPRKACCRRTGTIVSVRIDVRESVCAPLRNLYIPERAYCRFYLSARFSVWVPVDLHDVIWCSVSGRVRWRTVNLVQDEIYVHDEKTLRINLGRIACDFKKFKFWGARTNSSIHACGLCKKSNM